jgi:hypothetical protein
MMKRYHSFTYLTCLFLIHVVLIGIHPAHGAPTPAHKANTETSNHQIHFTSPEKAKDTIQKSTIQKPENLGTKGSLSVKALKETSWWTTVQKNIKEQEYHITYQDMSYLLDIKAAYQAPNRDQNLRTYFTSKGIKVVRRTESVPTWHADFTLSGLGKGDSIVSLPEDKEPKVNDHRIEFHRADVVEWYENRPDGLEQGFTINKKPEGNGPLHLLLNISGNVRPVLSKDGRTVNFFSSKDAEVLQYGNLKAFDAKGKALPSRFEFSGNLLKIVVDDSAANYPIVVDPLLTTPAWTAEGNLDTANFGYAVSTAGDVNGDGFDDVIVGADQFLTGLNEGKVFVYYGSASGLSTTADWTAVSDQESPTYFGTSVDTAGDVNGDGYDDIIIAADYYDNPGPDTINEGKVFVYYGSATGLGPNGTPSNADWTAESDQDQSYFGWEVSTAGDVNGDGYDDIIIGAIGYDAMAAADIGAAYVYHGSATGLGPNGTLTNADWSASGTQVGEGFGNTVDTAGNVNGDLYSDVIIGAPYYNGGETQEGRAFVYHGSATGLSTTANWTAESNQANAEFGSSVRSAGDVNGDGYSDIIIGAWNYNDTKGGAFVYHGSATGLGPSGTPANADWSDSGGNMNNTFGAAVGTAGDVNGDGYSEVIVGAPGNGVGTWNGWAYVYYGSAAGLISPAEWRQSGTNDGDNYGFAVSTAGDVNGDGFSDVIIGANYYDNGQTDEGAAYLYLGSNISPGTYHVDISQSSEGDGSAGNPWKTLHYAIQQINSGDPGIYTLIVAAGTYSVGNGEADATLVINQDNVTIQGAGAGSTIISGVDASTWQIGIEVNASNVTIAGCEVSNFTMNGINIYTGDVQIVEDCDIHDNDWGIYTNNTSPEIRKNKIYDNTTRGIYITVFDSAAYAPIIKNNLIYTTTGTMQNGIEVYTASTGSTASPSIYHNTIHGGTQYGIYIREDVEPITAEIKYNIITNFAAGISFSGTTPSMTIDYNDVSGNTTNYVGCTAGSNDISLDPSYVGGGNYDLQSGSPCIDAIPAGDPPNDPVSDDIVGNTRPQGSGYDMGCYESSSDWNTTTSLSVNRMLSVAAAPGNGYVYIINGYTDDSSWDVGRADGRVFYAFQNADGTLGAWSEFMASIAVNFKRAAAGVAQYNGYIYLAGGAINAPSYDGNIWYAKPESSGEITGWTQASNIVDNWIGSWPYMGAYNGYLYVGGGYAAVGNYSNRFYYAPINTDGSPGAWTQTTDLPSSVKGQLLFYNNRAYVIAGDDNKIFYANMTSGAIGSWTETTSLPAIVSLPSAQIINGRIYVVQGGSTSFYYSEIQTDGTLGSWVTDASLPVAVSPWEQGIFYNGYYYLIGDQYDSANLTRVLFRQITAPTTYTLTVNIVGSGTVSLSPSGGIYNENTVVTLTAVPDAGCNFMGWSGDLTSSTNPETITMDADKTVTATFNCPPDAPTASDPADETILTSGPVTIDTSIFSDPDSGDTHTESHWLVRRADSVYYRADYDPSFDVVSTSDLTQHTVSGLNSGMKYVWKVGYTDSGSGETSWSQECSFMIGTSVADSSVEIDCGTEEADFAMVSFVQWPDHSLSSSALGLPYDKRYFRIGTYDPTNGSGGYVEYGSSLMIEPGKAYWFLARDGLPLTLNGIPVSLLEDIDVGLRFNAGNQNGWNMIGCPNAADYNWDLIEVIEYNPSDGSIVFSPTAISALPDPNDYIEKSLWRWESGTYYPDTTVIEQYKGYWVKAKKANVFLRFRPSARASLSNPPTYFARLLRNGKQWMKKWIFTSQVAIADSYDSPPRPMGDFSTVTPDSVGGCFIATAVYGSPMERHVTILRDFRDTYLINSTIGHIFVTAYYHYSPPVADFIAKHTVVRVAARISFLPMVAFCYSALTFGLALTTCVVLLMFMSPLFLIFVYKWRV